VDSHVDARDRDEDSQGQEGRKGPAKEVAEDDRPGEARGCMPGRKGVAHRGPEKRLGLCERLVRPPSIDRHLDHEGDQVCSPDGSGRDEGRTEERPPGTVGEQRRERDPEQPAIAGDGKCEEEPVERRDTVLDDPQEEVAIGVYESS
jgi:hypothetical protein